MLFDERVARTASIPLVLWVCAAVVAHYAGGVGTMQVAEVVHDRDVLKAAVRSVRQSMHPGDTTFEVLTEDSKPTPTAKVEAPEKDAPTDGTKPDGEVEREASKDKTKPPPTPKPKDEPKKDEPKKVAEKPPPPKPEPLKPVAPLPAAAPPPPPPPPPDADHRIAVRQHAEKDQPDNPNANRIADDANHVDKEMMARNRSHDQDMKDPSFGASKGPQDDKHGAGDKEDKVADSEDKKGNDKHAAGEKNDRATDAHHETPKPPVPPSPTPAKAPPPSVPGGKGGSGAAPAVPAPPPSPGGAGPASPETIAAEKGGYTLDPTNPGGDGKSRNPGKKQQQEAFQSPVHVGSLGLGGLGLPGGPQLNLDMKGVEAAVGAEQLKAERAADGAARRSAHRGNFEKNKFQKWKAAIENYEPLVELGNTTALNAARSPFGTYLNTIHNRIHPIFAEEFLASLDSLSKSHQLNQDLVTHLEIVVSKDTGRIVSLGVTKASGATAFDVAALASVDRAGPFGKAPDIIASPDGNVYLHWEFHRDPFDACTTRNARPYILKNAPAKRAVPLGPRKKPGAAPSKDERGGPAGPLLPLRERE
ncbi:MAG: TonB C-terminal domain-containing protein [Minicystis sp.]